MSACPRTSKNPRSQAPWEPLSPNSLYAPRFIDIDMMAGFWKLMSRRTGQKAAPARVAILAGAGVEKSNASDLAATGGRSVFMIPVATTLRAKGVFPESHPLSLGVFGYAGHRWAIETLLSPEVEVLVVLGSGLNQRDTMYWNPKMLPCCGLVQVDIDPTVVGRTWHTDAPVVGDCGQFLRQMLEADASLTYIRAGGVARKSGASGSSDIKFGGPKRVFMTKENMTKVRRYPCIRPG